MKSFKNASRVFVVGLGLWAFGSAIAIADEGMWMINNLSARTDSILRSMGLELTHEQLYSATHPSLNDAIVNFGGFCSGVVVSDQGLVFTNHHCGFDAVQSHSTPENDYLTDGFFAKRLKDELPNEGLYVDFHLRTIDVTETLRALDSERSAEAVKLVENGLRDSVNGIFAVITPYHRGLRYYMSVYQRFTDVRLVFAPPQCLGKHGGDTDNWMWPRQTCDFSVFRIYTDKQGRPAEFSKDNIPLKPKNHARISLHGYQPGTFCMTLGYPGSTNRYLSSYGTESTMRNVNAVRVQVRGVKQDIMKKAMASSDALRIMYSSKYAASSNYWKYSIGQNEALTKLNVIEEKRETEKAVSQGLLDSLRNEYADNDKNQFMMSMIEESFIQGSDILQIALISLLKMMRNETDDTKLHKTLEKEYKDIDIETDKAIFAAMIRNYREKVERNYWPDFLHNIDSRYGGDVDRYSDDIYKTSVFTDREKILAVSKTEELLADEISSISFDVLMCMMDHSPSMAIDSLERELLLCLQKADPNHEFYPDANSTLRMSYGIVDGYTSEGTDGTCYTLPQSLIDKNVDYPDNSDYALLPSVRKWFMKGNFGKRYKDTRSGDMQLCFLSTNDITGGNSGSGMFDGKGRLIGLAFDGNWEAMSGDLKFDDNLQRCIGVDIRYVLSVIENYGKAKRLIKELSFE
ncbi:MAG: S46 family peptidase [Bacteroidaceae bacterium]|nr:S46 family peptidase [Bacteroidaceae bacterium]